VARASSSCPAAAAGNNGAIGTPGAEPKEHVLRISPHHTKKRRETKLTSMQHHRGWLKIRSHFSSKIQMVFSLALLLFLLPTADAQCANMTILNHTTCTQGAFKWTNETSSEACCATCEAIPKCMAWEYDTRAAKPAAGHPGNCHLKTKPGPTHQQATTTCGVRGDFPTPAPITRPPTPAPKPASPGSPNLVFFLTDDQDQKLGGSFPMLNGVGPMPKTQKLLVEAGATAKNWFIHTPICCPSRSELVTGRYFHNLKVNCSTTCSSKIEGQSSLNFMS
jgi:hypothetical protein